MMEWQLGRVGEARSARQLIRLVFILMFLVFCFIAADKACVHSDVCFVLFYPVSLSSLLDKVAM